MGGGGGQNTVTQQQYPAWVEAAGQDNYGRGIAAADRPYQEYDGPRVAGLAQDSLDAAARARALQGTGAAQIGQAMDYTRAATLGYTPQQISAGAAPQQITAGNYLPQMVQGPAAYSPLQVSAGAGPQNVNAGTIASGLSAYQNPYEDQVVQSGLQALDMQRRQALNQTSDQARAAGAFGGSRHALMEASLNNQAAMAAGQLAANTRSQGFTQALGASESDRNAALQAAQANQGAGLQYGQQSLAAQQANQAAGLQAWGQGAQLGQAAQLANQNAGLNAAQLAMSGQAQNASNQLQYGAQSLSAQQANQAANANAAQNFAQMNLNAGSQLGALAGAQSQISGQELGLLDAAGQQQRAVTQQDYDTAQQQWLDRYNYPIVQNNIRGATLGLTPYGTTTSQSTTGTGGSTAGQVVGGLTAGAGIASAIMSDPATKKDIEREGTDDGSGLGLYSWRYKGESESHPRSFGLMADEVADKFPEASINAGGVMGINPAALPPRLAAMAQGQMPRPDGSKVVSRRTLSAQAAEKNTRKGAR